MSKPKRTTKASKWAPAVAELPIPDEAKEAATIALVCQRHLASLSAVAKDCDDEELAEYGRPHLESLVTLIHGAREKVEKYAANYLAAKTLFAGLPGSSRATAHEAAIEEATGAVVLSGQRRWAELRERLARVDWLALRAAIVREAAALQAQEGTDDESNYISAKACRGEIDTTHDQLLGIIDRERIRTIRKGQRLLVNAGDWAHYKERRERTAQAALDDDSIGDFLTGMEKRKSAIHARKAKKGAPNGNPTRRLLGHDDDLTL